MDVTFKNAKLQKILESESNLKRKYGSLNGLKITCHLVYLRLIYSLASVPSTKPFRCHQLSGDRDEQFAVDLVHPFRLIFEVSHEPIPRDKFGGIDKSRVTAIRIMEVIDYH